MKLPSTQESATFGFLDVLELESLGHSGGLLTVTSIGRPLEFHCTAPVTANRAQQIMYGATYRGYLYADVIGTALVDRVKTAPDLLFISDPDLLPISESVDLPVLLLETKTSDANFDGSGLRSIELEQHRCWCIHLSPQQLDLARHHIQVFADKLPLDEPFERIAQAIEEAHSVLRAA